MKVSEYEYEMFCHTVIMGITGIVCKRLKKLETTSDQHLIDCLTRNITHHKESATIWHLKPEFWGSPLTQEENYQGK
jgi:hypothetical protein